MANTLIIGNTPLVRLRDLEKQTNCKRLFVKDESRNPFGTIKDRRNVYILEQATRLRVDKIVLITSGNNGYSLAQFAKKTSIKIVCIVSKKISPDIIRKLREVTYQVIELNLEHKILRPEELISFAREKEDEVIWDVTNGYEEIYDDIVVELLSQVKPDYIVVPVGSGGIYIGIVSAIGKRKLTTRILGIGTQNSIDSFADKLSTPWTPYARALEYYQKEGHTIYRLSENEINKTYRDFKNMITCEPSSSVVFAVFAHHQFKPTDTIVLLNSGQSQIK